MTFDYPQIPKKPIKPIPKLPFQLNQEEAEAISLPTEREWSEVLPYPMPHRKENFPLTDPSQQRVLPIPPQAFGQAIKAITTEEGVLRKRPLSREEIKDIPERPVPPNLNQFSPPISPTYPLYPN